MYWHKHNPDYLPPFSPPVFTLLCTWSAPEKKKTAREQHCKMPKYECFVPMLCIVWKLLGFGNFLFKLFLPNIIYDVIFLWKV